MMEPPAGMWATASAVTFSTPSTLTSNTFRYRSSVKSLSVLGG